MCICAKRVIVRPEQLIKGVSAEEVLREILGRVPTPVLGTSR